MYPQLNCNSLCGDSPAIPKRLRHLTVGRMIKRMHHLTTQQQNECPCSRIDQVLCITECYSQYNSQARFLHPTSVTLAVSPLRTISLPLQTNFSPILPLRKQFVFIFFIYIYFIFINKLNTYIIYIFSLTLQYITLLHLLHCLQNTLLKLLTILLTLHCITLIRDTVCKIRHLSYLHY